MLFIFIKPHTYLNIEITLPKSIYAFLQIKKDFRLSNCYFLFDYKVIMHLICILIPKNVSSELIKLVIYAIWRNMQATEYFVQLLGTSKIFYHHLSSYLPMKTSSCAFFKLFVQCLKTHQGMPWCVLTYDMKYVSGRYLFFYETKHSLIKRKACEILIEVWLYSLNWVRNGGTWDNMCST